MKKVTYVKGIGAFFLIASLVLIFFCLSIGAIAPLISTGMTFIISIFFLTNPHLTYDDRKIEQKNLMGSTVRTYYFDSDNISTRDGQVYKGSKRLRFSKIMLVPSEYNAMIEHIIAKSKDSIGPSNSPKHDDDLLDSEI